MLFGCVFMQANCALMPLAAKNCVGRAGACQVFCFTFMRFFVRMVVTAVGAAAFH